MSSKVPPFQESYFVWPVLPQAVPCERASRMLSGIIGKCPCVAAAMIVAVVIHMVIHMLPLALEGADMSAKGGAERLIERAYNAF